jgi:acyl transferase domain-containing protein
MQKLPPGGAMAAAFAAEEVVRPALKQAAGRVALAAVNDPGCVTISGDEAALTAMLARLATDGVETLRLAVSHAFHSPLMAPMAKGFDAVLAQHDFAAPRLPFYSTVTGDALPPRQTVGAQYWSRQIMQPVRFLDAIRTLERDGYSTFLELGPSDTLTGFARRACQGEHPVLLSSLRRGESAWKSVSHSLAELYVSGLEVSWTGFDAPYARRKVRTPTYPFQRQRYWLELAPLRESGAAEIMPSLPATKPPSPAPANMTHKEQRTVQITDQRTELGNDVAALLADVSGFAVSDIDYSRRLLEMGLDSIMLLKLAQAVERRYGVELRPSMLFEEVSTVDRLAGYVAQHATIQPRDTAAAELPPEREAAPAMGAANGDAAALFQQQLHYLSQVAAQNLESMTNLARQQMALLGNTANAQPPFATGMAYAPSPAPLRSPAMEPATAKATAQRAAETVTSLRGIKLASGPLTPAQSAFVDDLARRYVARTPTSKKLTGQSRAVLADWKHTLSFWGQLKETKYPIVSARSEGARFWDVDDNAYIDVAMGMGVHFFGHKAPFLDAALARQLQQGIELGTQTALAAKVAKLVCELTGVERVALSNTGSEAVMVALRLARAATGRDKIVIFKNSYHGIFDGVLAIEADGEIVS